MIRDSNGTIMQCTLALYIFSSLIHYILVRKWAVKYTTVRVLILLFIFNVNKSSPVMKWKICKTIIKLSFH